MYSREDIKKAQALTMRVIRAHADLSQSVVAERMGMPQTQYSRYETGVVELPLIYLIGFANACDEVEEDVFATFMGELRKLKK